MIVGTVDATRQVMLYSCNLRDWCSFDIFAFIFIVSVIVFAFFLAVWILYRIMITATYFALDRCAVATQENSMSGVYGARR